MMLIYAGSVFLVLMVLLAAAMNTKSIPISVGITLIVVAFIPVFNTLYIVYLVAYVMLTTKYRA